MRRASTLAFAFAVLVGVGSVRADVSLVGRTRTPIDLSGRWELQQAKDPSVREPIAGGTWETVEVPDKQHAGWSAPSWRDSPSKKQSLWYRRTFDAPQLNGRRAYVHFKRAGFQCRVWLNGREVGDHIGSQVAFQIDVTDALRQGGSNELLVGCGRGVFARRGEYGNMPQTWSEGLPGMPAEREDGLVEWPASLGYWFYGIYQPVSLVLMPSTFVDDVFVITSVRNQTLGVRVEVRSSDPTECQACVRSGRRAGPRPRGPRASAERGERLGRCSADGGERRGRVDRLHPVGSRQSAPLPLPCPPDRRRRDRG